MDSFPLPASEGGEHIGGLHEMCVCHQIAAGSPVRNRRHPPRSIDEVAGVDRLFVLSAERNDLKSLDRGGREPCLIPNDVRARLDPTSIQSDAVHISLFPESVKMRK